MPDGQGILRVQTTGPDNEPNGTVSSRQGVLRADAWQHVAAVVRRGTNETRLYVNGFPVGKGKDWSGKSRQSESESSSRRDSRLRNRSTGNWTKSASIAGLSAKQKFRDC